MKLKNAGYSLAGLSIGLGLAELVAGRKIARALGVPDKSGWVRAFGLRELGAGAALVARPTASSNAWMRVAGDVLDLAALAMAFRSPRGARSVLWGSVAFVGTALLADAAAGAAMRSKEAEEALCYAASA